MTVTAAIVLFSVVWFMVFFVVLPLRLVTQGDAGAVVPGTHEGAPHALDLGRKAWITTLWAVAIWAGLAALIVWGPWGVRDIAWLGEWFGRTDAPPAAIEAAPQAESR